MAHDFLVPTHAVLFLLSVKGQRLTSPLHDYGIDGILHYGIHESDDIWVLASAQYVNFAIDGWVVGVALLVDNLD